MVRRLIEHREVAKVTPHAKWTPEMEVARHQASILDVLTNRHVSGDGKGGLVYTEAIPGATGRDMAVHRDWVVNTQINVAFNEGWKHVNIEAAVAQLKGHQQGVHNNTVESIVKRLEKNDPAMAGKYREAWKNLKPLIWP